MKSLLIFIYSGEDSLTSLIVLNKKIHKSKLIVCPPIGDLLKDE